MSEVIQATLIAGFFTLVGSVGTTFINHYITVDKKRENRLKRSLVQAYRDIAAYHRLEFLYTNDLSNDTKSAEAIKRLYRRKLRIAGHDSPSQDATISVAEKRIQEYSK
jgi:hypothetical protein